MTEEKFKLIPAVHLILIKDDKILLLRRFNTGWEDGKYSVVAGHVDGEETCTQAMIRESREEADIDIKPEGLHVVHVMHRKSGDEERVDFFLKADKWEGEPKILEPNKCDNLSWFELDNLPNNIIPYVKYAIDNIRDGILYSEHG